MSSPSDTSDIRPHPFEDLAERSAREIERPGFHVDLRRCIGCHACSVACKTAHDIPLGEFPLRVRWLPRPDTETYAFVPVFSESLCRNDPESLEAGMDPVCARACPTEAISFVDFAESASAEAETAPLVAESAPDLKQDVLYRGLEDWVAGKINQGPALDPRDEDPIYEQD